MIICSPWFPKAKQSLLILWRAWPTASEPSRNGGNSFRRARFRRNDSLRGGVNLCYIMQQFRAATDRERWAKPLPIGRGSERITSESCTQSALFEEKSGGGS